ncbi:50S ribosomal protein L7/L12 [Spiroplasma ixodetis]|uniref:50S ribosomal protein L7/L12 n=1 Tax=Spiroplasma ixodetis TaxID=2141 RepID=A0ABN6SWW2_9MOLU|nr:50S ribosomal protein L7/L12 [Spiroplasma ixodetis]BDT03233.1 50S ribosomal protein L7/L12 [Spiroplasma ixodetis]
MENITNKQIIEHVKTMTAVQLKELVELIETTFGVTAAVASAPAAAKEEATKPSTVSVILKEVGDKKVDVIKAVKAIVGGTMSLIDAKKMVDAVATGPQKILENIDTAKATEHEATLKAVGAIVEVK